MNLLLDEMLSVRLPEWLAQGGVHAAHVVHRGLAGSPDHVVWRYAAEHDFVVVTGNADDYLNLASDTEIHGGMIIIRESGLSAHEQLERVQTAIREVSNQGEARLINHALEVENMEILRWLPIPPV